jgi:hypothetical protein
MMSASAIGGQFTYSYQLAGYEYDRYDEKGAIDFDRFVTLFDQFPWQNQVRAWDRLRKGCSATISVTDHDRQLDYWVSIAGDESESKFLLGVVYDKEVKGFLGFGKPRKTRWVEIHAAPSRESILSTYRLFFSGHTDELMHTLRSYELLDQLEARKPKA